MNQFYEVTAVSADAQELRQVAKRYGVKNHPIEMTREISPLQDLKSLWQFYRLCKKEKPFMVHSHTPKAGVVGMMGARLAGVPHRFHTVAGLPLMEATGLKRTLLNAVEKLTYACATKVYPNSKGLYDFIVAEQFCKPSKLKVLGQGSSNGIDTAYFDRTHFPKDQQQELRTQLGIQPDDFVFIFVGRLVGDKGINELIAVFKNLRHCEDEGRSNLKTPTIQPQHPAPSTPHPAPNLKAPKLLLVGPLETELDPLQPTTLEEIEHNENIISVGYQEDVRPYFALADALVFPSYREGFPNVVLQAGAMELPAIVSNINGCNEIIIEGENGLIIPVKNRTDLQEAMLKLATDQTLYDHLKINARSRIVKNYEQAVVWQAILAEYRTAEHHV